MVASVCTEVVPLAADAAEASRHEVVVVALRPVCHVVGLANVQRPPIVPAVAAMITDRLHAIAAAVSDHDVPVPP